MKKILFYFIVSGWAVACITACSKEKTFLDKTVTTNLDEQVVFRDSAYTMDFLTGIYTGMAFSFSPERFGGAGLNGCSDESIGGGTSRNNQYVLWTSGTVNAANVTGDAWSVCYTNIRRVNVLLKHLPTAPFSVAQQNAAKAEARFLRAWYYFILLKTYGGIPLVGDTVYNATDVIDPARNSYDECVNYIVAECDAAATELPNAQSQLYYGRITKGACLALKSRLLLYAASPLFNGGGPSGELLTDDADLKNIVGYPQYDKERWRKALDVGKALISSGLYSLVVNNSPAPGAGFNKVFLQRVNTEYVLPFMQANNSNLEFLWAPSTRGGMTPNTAYPTQEFVDAFTMKNGLPITDPVSGYDPAHPYDNRDPRFAYSVTHNESPMVTQLSNGVLSPVYTYFGYEPDGLGTGNGTRTGYYVQKMTDRYVIHNDIFTITQRSLPLMRYAETLLNYAEAENEYNGPTQEVYDQLIAIRYRAGIEPGSDGLYGLKPAMSLEEMRKAIYDERRIELAYEEHRFWDVRRWKIAEQTDSGPVNGMKIVRQSGAYTYEPFVLEERVFRKSMYLWPIPMVELAKSQALLQNPGW